MTIETLIKAIPPPAKPAYAFDEPWEPIQRQLGTQLPYDYKELTRLYGRGLFMEFFDIYGPKGPTLDSRLANAIYAARGAMLADLQGSLVFDDPPLPLWPRPGGLLACGQTGWGDYLFWLTRGELSEWPIVLWSRRLQQLEVFEHDLTDFLAGIMSGHIVSDNLPGRWDPNGGVAAFRSLPTWQP